MGVVYRARDARLSRDVAIKVLPSAFSADPNRLHRFEQEAQAASALNHPNILSVFDFGEHEGAPYVVSELLEGETLRDQLVAGPLEQRKAIIYATQVAHGLSAAHDRAITHRDIKPENIFVTRDDRVKILDFGLAKLAARVEENVPQTDVPTRKVITEPGTIMGTIGYMSPEQAAGKPVDHRSDIFSFGAVVYEMLTGQRAFIRDSKIETLNAILKEEPPEFTLAAGSSVAPALESIVRHCLEKKPERRFQSANDVAFALEHLTSPTRSTQEVVGAQIQGRRLTREHLAWLLAGVLLLTTIAAAFLYYRRTQANSYASRFLVYPPDNTSLAGWDLTFPVAVSPDGRQLALVAGTSGTTRLWLRALNSLEPQPFDNTDGAQNPFWSPDGRYIAFFAGGKLKKIHVSGGVPTIVCDAPPNANAGTWSAQDIILFTSGQTEKGILRVSATGGEVTEITKLDRTRQDLYHFWPQFLPDGRHFFYLVGSRRREESAAYIGSVDGGENTRLMQANSRITYSPPGYILFLRDGALLAQAFDASSLRLSGEQLTVAEHVGNFSSTGNSYFSVSANGEVLAYLSGSSGSRLVWQNRGGGEEAMIGSPGDYFLPRLSTDGEKIAVDVYNPKDGTNDIWIYDLSRNTFTRFTFDIGLENGPVWSPDGERIVYAHDRDGPPHLFLKRLSDPGEAEMLLPPGEGPQVPNDWSADGQFLIDRTYSSKTRSDLLVLPMTGERKPIPFAQTPFNEFEARLSPDGKWLAYVSDESGRREVYVDRFPGGGQRSLISNAGGRAPRWHPNGREFFFVSAQQKLMALEVKSGDKFGVGTERALFQLQSRDNQFEVSRDGQRFLVNTVAGVQAQPLTVSTGWVTNLKR